MSCQRAAYLPQGSLWGGAWPDRAERSLREMDGDRSVYEINLEFHVRGGGSSWMQVAHWWALEQEGNIVGQGDRVKCGVLEASWPPL